MSLRGAEPCPHVPSPSQRLLIGAEAVLTLRANATNAGEGAFEAELRVQLPPGTHYQAARSTIPVGVEWGVTGVTRRRSCLALTGVWGGGLTSCPWWPSPFLGVPSGGGCWGMPSTGGDPHRGAHTVSFISIILYGGAWWGWVPRDPGLGGSCPALGGHHPPWGAHR